MWFFEGFYLIPANHKAHLGLMAILLIVDMLQKQTSIRGHSKTTLLQCIIIFIICFV